MKPTPADLRAAATEARDEAKRLRLQAAALDVYAAELDGAAALGLTMPIDRALLERKMQAQPVARKLRKVGRPVLVQHKFRSWLDGQRLNVKEWAEDHNRPQSTVRAWMRPLSDGGRKIPEGDALMIQNEAGRDDKGRWLLPATTATWPNGLT